ncbi:MAG: GNAT family N-acetyltransferase [Propionibacteriaceae bacterium]|nr:GNAT family N-acetyltransferase [Propionibacteriaceae bacterium]
MALRAERDHTARTYVSFDDNAPHSRVIGYYCLSSYSVERLSIGGGYLARNAPPAVPAILLGRLAVDITWQGKGLGASLLHDAVNNAELVSRRIGSRALVVDALDEPAAAFYRRYGFHPFPSNPFKLFHRF